MPNVGMVQRGQDFCLTLEAGEPVGIAGKSVWQHLDRHLPIKVCIRRLIDLAHAPLADEGGDVVAPNAFEPHLIRPETEEAIPPPETRA